MEHIESGCKSDFKDCFHQTKYTTLATETLYLAFFSTKTLKIFLPTFFPDLGQPTNNKVFLFVVLIIDREIKTSFSVKKRQNNSFGINSYRSRFFAPHYIMPYHNTYPLGMPGLSIGFPVLWSPPKHHQTIIRFLIVFGVIVIVINDLYPHFCHRYGHFFIILTLKM